MQTKANNRDQNKILEVADAQPRVRIANRHPYGDGTIWGPRRSVDPQLILVLEGQLAYADATNEALAGPGELLCIPGGRRHTLRALAAGVLTGMHLEFGPGSWAAGDYRLAPEPPLLARPADPAAATELLTLAAQTHCGYGAWRQPRLDALAKALLLLLAEDWRAEPITTRPGRTAAMLDLLRRRLPRSTGRVELARAFGLTPEYVNALFRRELGMSPSAVLNRERCLLAHQHLLAGASVAAAAAAAGYSDPGYFSRVYRRQFHRTPREVLGGDRFR